MPALMIHDGYTQPAVLKMPECFSGELSIKFRPMLPIEVSTYFDARSERPDVKAFVEEFHRCFGAGEVSQVAAVTYDAALVLAEALRQCSNREELRTYLDSFGSSRPLLEGITGRYALDHPRNLRPVRVLQIRSGAYHPLEQP